MRSLRLVLALALVGASFSIAAPAFAKKDKTATTDAAASTEVLPKIELTSVAEFDTVFQKAKDIESSIDLQQTSLATARANVNTALGVATDAPLATALGDLKSKAGGNIKLAMDGTTPKLAAGDAMPENFKSALDAVNGLVTAGVDVAKALADMPAQTKELVSSVKTFPMQLPKVLTSVDADTATKIKTVLPNNIKAIKAFPSRVSALVAEAQGVVADVAAAFK